MNAVKCFASLRGIDKGEETVVFSREIFSLILNVPLVFFFYVCEVERLLSTLLPLVNFSAVPLNRSDAVM